MSITEFLESRIAEDEAAAKAATPGPWTLYDRGVGWEINELPEPHDGLTFYKADAFHVARHGPARVLAECAAKRAIIAEHKPDWAGPVCVRCRFIGGYVEFPCPTIRYLAAVYASHADYREEWEVA